MEERDYDDEIRSKTAELAASLREKDTEIEHLDQRLRERSEKLNEQMTKVNLTTKENIKAEITDYTLKGYHTAIGCYKIFIYFQRVDSKYINGDKGGNFHYGRYI